MFSIFAVVYGTDEAGAKISKQLRNFWGRDEV